MLIMQLLADSYGELERAGNTEQLQAAMQRFAGGIGFDNVVYALTINAPSYKPTQYVLSGYPEEWVQKYLSCGYFEVDPIVKASRTRKLPAIWSEELFRQNKADEFWEEARTFGLNEGISFFVQDQPGVSGIFSISRDKGVDLQGSDLAAMIGRAQMFAGLLHQAISRIDLPDILSPEGTHTLTAREIECLKWSADGKTAWEIGQILNIAERTAVFHLSNAMQKLGASNKTQAIVRAVVMKLV